MALACAPTAAFARRSTKFVVTVAGTVQTTASLKEETCPIGSSSDVVSFTSNAVRVKVEDTGPFLAMIGLSRGGETDRQALLVRGTVTRSSSGEIACKNSSERPVDCGTKPFAGLRMELQGLSRSKRKLDINVLNFSEDPTDVFTNCYVPGGFPSVVSHNGIDVLFSSGTLFGRARTIVKTVTHPRSGEGGYGAAIKEEVTLTLTLRRT